MFNLFELFAKYKINATGLIHVGAWWGTEHTTYKSLNINRIVYFEPLRENFLKLKSAIGHDARLYNYALGNEEKDVDMFVDTGNNSQSSSVLEPAYHTTLYPNIVFKNKQRVKMKRLDSYAFSKIYNFMCIDVQGYELEVLKGAENTLNNINYIICEVNKEELYKSCAKIDEVDAFLKGYNLTRVETLWNESQTWGDAFYIKT
jgi:FkbM family methyltransferase